MNVCMICGEEIGPSENTFEHLIPASLGGRRGVHGFIHRACNSKAGETWDAALAAQLQPLSLMFAVRRQRGATPSLSVTTTANERFSLGTSGQLRHSNPLFEKTKRADGKLSIQIKARDPKEARSMLKNLKRKHPDIDTDALMAAAQVERSYAQGAIQHSLSIGGTQSGRSIVKSCLAMAFASGIGWAACKHALRYMREEQAEPPYGFYTERDLVEGRIVGMPMHCLAVRANPQTGLILAYVEYYGTFRIVACLGNNYVGAPIEACCAIDPRSGSEQLIRVDLAFDEADIADIYAYKKVDFQVTGQALSSVIGPALKEQQDKEQQRVINEAVHKAFDTCGAKPGEILTDEHVRKICRTMAEEMTPYLLHRVKPVMMPPDDKRPARRR